MDNLPKDIKSAEEANSGSQEIYPDKDVSDYQKVADNPEQSYQNTSQPFQEAPLYQSENQPSMQNPGFSPPAGDTPLGPPPSYAPDKGKRLMFILFILGIFGAVIFIGLKIFQGKKTPPPENQQITLNYWSLWEDEKYFRPLIDEYKRTNPNIDIKFIKQDPKLYRDRLQYAIENSKENIDIFRFHNTWVPMLINFLSPLPKEILSDEEYSATFYPVAVKDLKNAGNFVGIPLHIDGLLLFYNESMLKSANVKVPSTWEDVFAAVPKLTVKEKNVIVTSAIALGTAENVEHFSDILGLMMLQNRTNLNKSVNSCEDPTSKDCAVQVLTYYRKFAEYPNTTWDENFENSITAFANGKVAMVIAPSWQAFTIKAQNPNLDFKTAPVPQLPCIKSPCTPVHWASYWVEGVSSKSNNQLESWKFLKFLSQKESLEKLYLEAKKERLFGEAYSRVDLAKSLSEDPYLAPLMSSAPYMTSFYLSSRTNDGETGINTRLINYLKDAVNSLSKGTSPESALNTFDAGLQQVFGSYGINPNP